ncbi:MAG: hypothetical protein GXP58_10210 [Deltaproteobacteria bacterium]|nr:hypothetical protein [Deltaproteobacteria bacterium]
MEPKGRPEELRELNRRLEEMILLRTEELNEKSRELERQNRVLARANEKIREADRLKSEFLANISHELRTPMNSILGYTNMLIKGSYGYLNENQLKNLMKVYENAQHLMHVIDDLLNLSHLELGKAELRIEPLSVKKLVLSSLVSIEPQLVDRVLHLEHRIPEDLPKVLAGEVRIKEVLINLIGNAVKFTPDHGRIFVEAKALPAPPGSTARGVVEIRVRDNGIGIREEDQEVIFDQFRQLNGESDSEQRGAGLGLYISKKFVEAYGGGIRVESAEGEGSIFSFTLPVADAESGSPQNRSLQ